MGHSGGLIFTTCLIFNNVVVFMLQPATHPLFPPRDRHSTSQLHMHASRATLNYAIQYHLLPVLSRLNTGTRHTTRAPTAAHNGLQSHPRHFLRALPHPDFLLNLHSRRLLCRLVWALQGHLARLRAARQRREQAWQDHLLQSRR